MQRRRLVVPVLVFGLISLSACGELPTASPDEAATPSVEEVTALLAPSKAVKATSGLITFDFTGEFTNAFDAFGVLGGLSTPIPFTGSYSFDPFTSDGDAHPDNGRYESTTPGTGIEITFDAFSVETPGVDPVLGITTSDEPPGNSADIYSVRSGDIDGTAGFPAGWVFEVLIDIHKGSPSDLLTSDGLPRTPPDISIPGVMATFQVVGGPDSENLGSLNLEGRILSLTPRAIVMEDCKNGGWDKYGFKNQGQCIRYVNTGKDSRFGE